jgi:hypothetical protein
MALGEVCPRRRGKGKKETNFGLFPGCRGGKTRINAAHSKEKRKKGVGKTVFAQILWLRAVPVRLGQPPPGWIRVGSAFFTLIHVFLRVSARLADKNSVTDSLNVPHPKMADHRRPMALEKVCPATVS